MWSLWSSLTLTWTPDCVCSVACPAVDYYQTNGWARASQFLFLVTSLFQANWDQSHQQHVTATFLTAAYTPQWRWSLLVLEVSHQCKCSDEQMTAAVVVAYFLSTAGCMFACSPWKFLHQCQVHWIGDKFTLNVTITGARLHWILYREYSSEICSQWHHPQQYPQWIYCEFAYCFFWPSPVLA